VIGHCRGFLPRAAVLQIRRDASRSETVIADRRRDTGRLGAATDHGVRIVLVHRRTREQSSPYIGKGHYQRFLEMGIAPAIRAVHPRLKCASATGSF
jgi:hypothetical protein